MVSGHPVMGLARSWHGPGPLRLNLAQAGDEQRDDPPYVVLGVLHGPGDEVTDGSDRLVRANLRHHLAGLGGRVEQVGQDRDEAIEEELVQGRVAGVVALPHLRQAVLGAEEVDEEVDPVEQRGER